MSSLVCVDASLIVRRPRAYDTAYLTHTQLNNCDFWTADEKLYNSVDEELDWVKWIGNDDL